MTLSRDRFIATQAEVLDELFGLAPGEEVARRTFEQLALDTYDALAAAPIANLLPFDPYDSASNFAVYDRGAGKAVPDELRDRWRAWQAEYIRLSERHPVLELRDAINAISESHDRSSWPTEAFERIIWAWMDAGDPTDVPFDDRDNIATPALHRRLRELRRAIQGWLFQDREAARVVLVRD